MQVILAQPRGFCAGVERAIQIVETALERFGPPIYVKHEIVHNKRVVDELRAKGVKFVEDINEIPIGAITVFSAHGVSKKVVNDAADRSLQPLDATCPLVTKVHKEGIKYSKKGYEIILIGHENHPEVEGTLGQIPGTTHLIGQVEDVAKLKVLDPDKLAYVTQTTLSVDDTRDIISALRLRFPNIEGPDVKDICYATQNRQIAVRALASQVDLMLVVGAKNSSNSNRLCDVSADCGVTAHLLQDSSDFNPNWIEGINAIGITAGASAPEQLVKELIEEIQQHCAVEVSTMKGISESVKFKLPDALTATTGEPAAYS